MQVTYEIMFGDCWQEISGKPLPATCKDMVAGHIVQGAFTPIGSVAEYFYTKRQDYLKTQKKGVRS